MKSQLSERLGSTAPVILHRPPDVHSLDAAAEAIELANAYGVAGGYDLDESQELTLRTALGTRVDGTWAAAAVGDFEPRQNGKNDTANARELAGLLLYGEELIIHTAHEFSTANESFLRLVAIFENYDDLRARVERIRYANGEQGIELYDRETGRRQRLKYKARTGGSGRGFAQANLVVYDEAQHLQREHVAASGPARLANPNPQSWYLGSGGFSTSALAWKMRRRALSGDGGRLAYVEHTAEDVELGDDGRIRSTFPGDVLDPAALARANPAYGRRITHERLLDLYDELGPDLFGRECLCLWEPEPGDGSSVIPADLWTRAADPTYDPPAGARLAYALDVSPDGRSAAVAVSDGTFVELVKVGAGTGWVVPALEAKRHLFDAITLDPIGPAGALLDPIERAGITVRQVTTREAVQACGRFMASLADNELVHLDQSELNAAAGNAGRRDVGDGGWLWSRKRSTVDIAPLVAVTLAKWDAETMTTTPRTVPLATWR